MNKRNKNQFFCISAACIFDRTCNNVSGETMPDDLFEATKPVSSLKHTWKNRVEKDNK